ncbi:DUF1849 family protein [Magnetovibrio sp. PR-2]|uniref:EipB family protein n=1 Tax=Magnetovibrio sp. PR-2 TaxID=3120356 RepID=UPI002FCE30C4
MRFHKWAKNAALTAALLAGSAGSAEAANLVSYRAIYDVRLSEARSGSAVTAASGQIAYGTKENCDSWIINQTGAMFLQTSEGDVLPQPLNFSAWESQDGTQYRFSVMGEDADATILGGAKKQGEAGAAEFSKPQSLRFDLPKGTLFPMVHTDHIINQAQKGVMQFQNYVFEGTDVEGAKLLVTFVSPLSSLAESFTKSLSDTALTRPGWNFRLAYFNPEDQASIPMYEIEADYLDNGVPVRWVLDYGDFSVEMGLSKFETLPAPECS